MLEPPKNIGQGIPLVEGVLSKIREILAYLEQSRLIPGKGIRLMETPSGKDRGAQPTFTVSHFGPVTAVQDGTSFG